MPKRTVSFVLVTALVLGWAAWRLGEGPRPASQAQAAQRDAPAQGEVVVLAVSGMT